MTLLNRKIDDPRFNSLIGKIMKTRVRETGGKEQTSDVGTPQGAIISPLLSNIILHEFDLYMEEYIRESNRGKTRKVNPAYLTTYKKEGLKAARKLNYSDPMHSGFRRMNYVRYADDFLITIIGTKKEAETIKQRCTDFLAKLKLTLSDEKTLITNPKDRPIRFLGYLIQKAAPKASVYLRRYAGK